MLDRIDREKIIAEFDEWYEKEILSGRTNDGKYKDAPVYLKFKKFFLKKFDLTLAAVLALLDAKIAETDKQIKRASEEHELIALPTLCALKVVLREVRAEIEKV